LRVHDGEVTSVASADHMEHTTHRGAGIRGSRLAAWHCLSAPLHPMRRKFDAKNQPGGQPWCEGSAQEPFDG
jgi:hypothetical protein